MNVFVLDEDPAAAARAHCDIHIGKMAMETSMVLSNAWHLADPSFIPVYKTGYASGPWPRWAVQTAGNYTWIRALSAALFAEFSYRFGHVHGAEERFHRIPANAPAGSTLFNADFASMPQCMPDPFKVAGNPVAAYRNYYKIAKRPFAKWERGTPPPDWWEQEW